MNTTITTHDEKLTGFKEPVSGLGLRGFQGEVDFPKMLAVIHASASVDGLERADNLEDIRNNYAHLHHSDPTQDMLMAEVDGELVGYTRCWWETEGSGSWVGFQFGSVVPQWRNKGIGSALLRFSEARLAQIAGQLKKDGVLPVDAPCILDNFITGSELARQNLLERRGYRAVRHTYEMLRPHLDDVPDLPLPPGVEVRQVKLEQMRQIWEASNEAFRDHWGYIPDPWEEFERLLNDPDFDPGLWRVAWQDDQVAGMVLSFIDKDQNEKYGRKRGYTENICVRRPWRKQGLAKALIALSLKALKDRGMLEAGLGVDAENISGALHLYQKMGYQVIKHGTIYRKDVSI